MEGAKALEQIAGMMAKKNSGVAAIASAWGIHRGQVTNLFTLLRRLGHPIRDGRTNELPRRGLIMQCYYCGVKMTRSGTKKPTSATWDHRIPKSRGGERYGDNRVRSCRRCNTKKGSLTDVEFLNGRNPILQVGAHFTKGPCNIADPKPCPDCNC